MRALAVNETLPVVQHPSGITEKRSMPRREKEWRVQPNDTAAIENLARSARISPLVAQLLTTRRIVDAETARRYLEVSMMDLYAPMTLPGVPDAADRLWSAISSQEPVCIFGDYDADGVTGTAILVNLI